MAQSAHASTSVVLPGQLLGRAGEVIAGDGTFVWGQEVRAAAVGACMVAEQPGQPQVVCVVRDTPASVVPAVGDVVVCRVTRIAQRMASVEILCVGNDALGEPAQGVIRREDVREFGQAQVQIYQSFRPGDMVSAKVLSLGDARAYFLSTAEPELGVVAAKSAEAAPMTPVSWEEMECPLTMTREFRKVARPQGAIEAASS